MAGKLGEKTIFCIICLYTLRSKANFNFQGFTNTFYQYIEINIFTIMLEERELHIKHQEKNYL